MPRLNVPTTAEHVLGAVEAVITNAGSATAAFVGDFLEITTIQAEAALDLAVELSLLECNAGSYKSTSPLCRFIAVPNQMQKAAVLRVVLEAYEPFVVFRQRFLATTDVVQAAKQTKTLCQLGAHRDEIRATLLSLGTYSQVFTPRGGGTYELDTAAAESPLFTLAQASAELLGAELRIRSQLGPAAETTVSRDDVILPLANALLDARSRDPEGAVQKAAKAVESHLDALAGRIGVPLGGATGINGKIDRLTQAGRLPKKLAAVGKYLGNVRNAADHGLDTEIGTTWIIKHSTGVEYVFVACSFISSTIGMEKGHPPEI